MKIYNLSDVHLATRRSLSKLDDINISRLRLFLEQVKDNSIVTIAGDLFDLAIVNSFRNYETVNVLIEMLNHFHVTKNINFMIIAGNHDYFYDVENKRKLGLFKIIKNVYNTDRNWIVKTKEELPPVIITDGIADVEIEDEGLRFCLMSFNSYDEDTFVKSCKGYKNILVCHGTTEDEVDEKYPNSTIPDSMIRKFDIVFKGHIHQRYNNGKIFSNGSVINVKSNTKTGYTEYDTGNGVAEIKTFDDQYNINYVTGVYNKGNISNILESLDEMSIASIYFKGNPEDIDPERFNWCFNNCLDFKIIFDRDVTNRISSDENEEDIFISLDEYFKKNLDTKTQEYIKKLRSEFNE